MPDYRDVFGEKAALGLGLGPPAPVTQESAEDYKEDPAAAFTRMAERLLPPGGAIPAVFMNVVKDEPPAA